MRMFRTFRPALNSIAALGVALVLGACASRLPERPASPEDFDRSFEVNGRFAIRAGTDAGSGRIGWQHAPASDELTLSTPIGIGLARLVRAKGVYTLSTNDGRTESEVDPDVLTEKLLGWRLPIAGLPYWIRGRVQPGLPADQTVDAGGRLATLSQSGWRIEYQGYHDLLGVPTRMRLQRDAMDLRLVLDEWQPFRGRTP